MSHQSTLVRRPTGIGLLSVFGLLALAAVGHAQTVPGSVTNANLFSGKPVAVSSTYPNAAFAAGNAVDGAAAAFVFADSDTGPTLTISGISSGINTVRFFDVPQFTGRTPSSVVISTSTNGTTFNALGTFALPTDTTHTNYQTASSDTTGGFTIRYDTLTGLALPAGTTSLRFGFTPFTDATGFVNGPGLSEIQGFVTPAPEPSQAAALGLGAVTLAGLTFRARRRGLPV